MQISLLNQFEIFFIAIIFGAVLGIIYDFLTIHRIITNSDRLSVTLQDIIFFALGGILSFLFIMVVTGGNIRSYIIVAEFLGFLMYHVTLGRIFIKIFSKIIFRIKRIFSKLYLIIFIPIIGFMQRKCTFFILFIKNKFKNIKNLQKN